MSESEIQRAIHTYLDTLPSLYFWRNNTGVGKAHGFRVKFGQVGSGDFLGILPDGRFLSIEVKSKTGSQSREQRTFQERIEASKGVYILARSVEDVVSRLRAEGVVP